MNTSPIPAGTPDDWWENAEIISHAEAEERNLGDWYIVRQQTAGATKPNYRISTPSKPPNMEKRLKPRYNNGPSDRVRCLIRGKVELPAWMTADYVQADEEEGSEVRAIWVRKKTGRWHCLTDGRKTINDHTMALLHPKPATFTVDDLI